MSDYDDLPRNVRHIHKKPGPFDKAVEAFGAWHHADLARTLRMAQLVPTSNTTGFRFLLSQLEHQIGQGETVSLDTIREAVRILNTLPRERTLELQALWDRLETAYRGEAVRSSGALFNMLHFLGDEGNRFTDEQYRAIVYAVLELDNDTPEETAIREVIEKIRTLTDGHSGLDLLATLEIVTLWYAASI